MFWLYWQTHWSGCGMYCMWIWHKLLQTLQDLKALQTNKRVKLKCDILLNDDGEVVGVLSIQQYYYKIMQISFSDFHPRYVSPSRTIVRDFKSNKGQSLSKNVILNSSWFHQDSGLCIEISSQKKKTFKTLNLHSELMLLLFVLCLWEVFQ